MNYDEILRPLNQLADKSNETAMFEVQHDRRVILCYNQRG
jgi:hypothetical protein